MGPYELLVLVYMSHVCIRVCVSCVLCLHIGMERDRLPYGLLLKDVPGYVLVDLYVKDKIVTSCNKQTVEKGTILITLSHEEAKVTASKFNPPHNYKAAVLQEKVTLHCDQSQVYPLNRKQRDLIQGVRGLQDRLEVIHKLEWVEKLHLGSFVYVTVPTIPVPVKGIINHLDRLPGEAGIKFGVELMVCWKTCTCMCL